ncbi:Ger(x)C family spore germination protein [Thermotalea metallivorans]|uniref:Spore germination protein A3 n=1 Tax=Thermotalea metallivorans TaxID=520762 RepID=A0A140L6M1_9FIRM|nr:Ger(x)C family spore germination protein [Thermotalea metallivorans]KXG76196.1 Spore germination protein A3 [Thermotalea metallivorans]
MHREKILLLLLIMTIGATGCWDKVEIENRAFVTAVAIDKFEPKKDQEARQEEGKAKVPEDSPSNRYIVTYAYPNTGLIAGKGEGEPRFQFTATGKTISDINNGLATRMEGSLFFGHVKLIVLGESLAKDEQLMREVLDAIERSPQIGRKISLMITPGTAEDILAVKAPQEPALGLYIRNIIEQQKRTARIADADLGYILRSLHESKAAVVPRIVASEKEVKIAGAAVLKDYKQIGWLGELETRALMFMMNKAGQANITVEMDKILLPVHIYHASTDIRIEEKDGEIYTIFDISMEGELQQHLFEVKGQTYDDKYLKKLEKTVSKELEQQIQDVYKKIQKEYETDLLQLNERLRKNKPDLWEKVKKQWDEIYPRTKMAVHVATEIRRIGVSR